MADLTKKTRFCNICIRKLNYPSNFESKLHEYCESLCERYTYVKHENDINPTGEIEDTHYHLVLIFKKNQRLSTRLNELVQFFKFDNPFGIKIEKTVSQTLSIQYLIHKNNPDKTQHSIDEVKCNYDRGELKCLMESKEDTVNTFDYFLSVIMEEDSILKVIERIGLVSYKHYRNVIWDMINGVSFLKARYSNQPVTRLDK